MDEQEFQNFLDQLSPASIPKLIDTDTEAILNNASQIWENIPKVDLKVDERLEELKMLRASNEKISLQLENAKSELEEERKSHKHDFLKNLLIAVIAAIVTFTLTEILPKIISLASTLSTHK